MTSARVVVACAVVLTSAALHAGKTSDVPLGVSYRNDSTDGVTSDGLMSLSGLPYQYVNGVADNIGAVLKGGGNLIYSAQYSTTLPNRRSVCLNFGAQASPLGAQQLCPYANQNMDPPFDALSTSPALSSLHYGDVATKRLQIWWDDKTVGYRYHVRYGGDMNGDGVADAPPVTVACVAPSDLSQPCSSWTVTSGAYAIVGRSRLLKGGQLGAFEFLGYYNLPFASTLWKL